MRTTASSSMSFWMLVRMPAAWAPRGPSAAALGPRRVQRPHACCLPGCLRCPGTRVRSAQQEGLGLSHGPHIAARPDAPPPGGSRQS
jgi:hypothetical protein